MWTPNGFSALELLISRPCTDICATQKLVGNDTYPLWSPKSLMSQETSKVHGFKMIKSKF